MNHHHLFPPWLYSLGIGLIGRSNKLAVPFADLVVNHLPQADMDKSKLKMGYSFSSANTNKDVKDGQMM